MLTKALLKTQVMLYRDSYTAVQKFGVLYVLNSICSPRLRLFDEKYSKNSNIVINSNIILLIYSLNFQQPLLQSSVSH